ncbi:Ig-like domain-containing protein, partial [Fibrobacterota bacterium]
SSRAGLNPVLSITFDEAVYQGAGKLLLYEAGAGPAAICSLSMDSSLVTGWGTTRIQFAVDVTLDSSTSYYVLVDGSCFQDDVGNFHPGISDSAVWTFTTLSPGDAVVLSMSYLSPATLYKQGDTAWFSITFSEPVVLTGGSLQITLETGPTDRVVNAGEAGVFSSSILVPYVVQYGDSSDALQVVSLNLIPGVTLQNAGLRDVVLDIGPSNNLPGTAGIDGIPPQLSAIMPLANSVSLYPYVSYTSSEDLSYGVVSWSDGFLGGQPLAPLIRQDSVLSALDLAAGAHEIRLSGATLVPGARYTVNITVLDSAGNQQQEIRDLVKLAGAVSLIRVVPGDTSVPLGASLQFSAVGLDTAGGEQSQMALESEVLWSASGPAGVIGASGIFQSSSLGEGLVIADYLGMRDTAVVRVDSVSLTAGPDNNVVSVGREAVVEFPAGVLLEDEVLTVTLLEESARPPGLLLSGPSLVFGERTPGVPWSFVSPMTLRFQIDSAMVGVEDLDKVQVYMQPSAPGAPWVWVPSVRAGYWLSVSTTSLGTYVVALDTIAPTLTWISQVQSVHQGEQIDVALQAADNIANPEVRLRVYVGGGAQEYVYSLDYSSGRPVGQIPAALVTSQGLWYAVEIWDGANLVSLDKLDVRVTVDSVLSLPPGVSLAAGSYHLFSVPMDPGDKSVSALFHDDWGAPNPEVWRLYAYDSVFYEMTAGDAVLPGRSYWVRTSGISPTVTLAAGTVSTLPVSRAYAVPLRSRWNCISNPFMFTVPVDSVTLSGGAAVQYLYGYVNGLWQPRELLTGLEPWQGYLVWNGPSGLPVSDSVRLSPRGGSPPVAKSGALERGGWLGVSVSGGGFRDGLLVLGYGYAGSAEGRDLRDHPKPAFFTKPVEAGLLVPWDRGRSYLTDYRGELGQGQSWRFRVANNTGDSTVLGFDGLARLGRDLEAVLLDESRDKVWPLSEAGAGVAFLAGRGASEEFELLVGTAEYIEGGIADFHSRARVFSMEQNFPNPFTATTAIRFSLPHAAGVASGAMPVSLEVFDIQGRKVITLLRGW